MRMIVLLTFLCMLLSCGDDTGGSEAQREVVTPSDSAVAEAVPADTAEMEAEYSTIEDYGRITNKEGLVSEFGRENLMEGESWYAEGTVRFEHTVLTDPGNGQVITYVWQEDGETLSHIEAEYYIYDEEYLITGTQEVFSECGVSTGMSLDELREWNRDDFDFLGFGWDYEGGIVEEEGSRIAECPVEIKLSFDLQADLPEEYTDMYGDRMFSTADEMVQGAPVLVDRLTYRHPDQ